MGRRIAKTIVDVHDLLADYNAVLELREGGTVTVQFPPSEKWQPKYEPLTMPVQYDENNNIVNDHAGINCNRQTFNVVHQLTNSPQFWRVTTVADQLTQFKFASGEKYGLKKITKKASQPLTLHFVSAVTAKEFFYAATC